jgi:hypothetical protein
MTYILDDIENNISPDAVKTAFVLIIGAVLIYGLLF